MTAVRNKKQFFLVVVAGILLMYAALSVLTYAWAEFQVSQTRSFNRATIAETEKNITNAAPESTRKLSDSLQSTNSCQRFAFTPLHARQTRSCLAYNEAVAMATKKARDIAALDDYIAASKAALTPIASYTGADPASSADRYFSAAESWQKIQPPETLRSLHAQSRQNLTQIRQLLLEIADAQAIGAPFRFKQLVADMSSAVDALNASGISVSSTYSQQAAELQRALDDID